jgi:hypothetical protein
MLLYGTTFPVFYKPMQISPNKVVDLKAVLQYLFTTIPEILLKRSSKPHLHLSPLEAHSE